eukprot:SAG22_NODE_190_length_15715_cov_21.164980_4_plen_2282_part_00
MAVFVQTTNDGGVHTMPLTLTEAGVKLETVAWLMSFFISILLNLVTLNLFLAVCCQAYSDVAARSNDYDQKVDRLKAALRKEMIANETAKEREARIVREAVEAEAKKTVHQRMEEKSWIDSSSKCAPFRELVRKLVLSEPFETATSFVIVGNTVTMALAQPGMEPEHAEILSTFETVFLAIYCIEAFLKLMGSGRKLYLGAIENRFDLFVILSSVVGYIATFHADNAQDAFGLEMQSMQSFRAVRLLRALQVVRLLHRQKELILVMKTIFKAWRPLLWHSLFCLFSMSVFAITGMQLFGGSLGAEASIGDYDKALPEHYEVFANGLLTCFELTVGEEWSHSMYWYMEHSSKTSGYPTWIIQLFFLIMFVWMNCILFSLYLAMLLENFSVPEKEKLPAQNLAHDKKEAKAALATKKKHQSTLQATITEDKAKGAAIAGHESVVHMFHHSALHVDLDAKENKSLRVFRLDSHVRITCAKIQESKYFQNTVMGLIMFSCVSLAAEGNPDASKRQDLVPVVFGHSLFVYLNILVLVAFILEALLKVIIHGFLFKSGPTHPYLSSRMNQLDFFIIVACLATYLPFFPIGGPWARALRLGRVVTPLMNLSKHPEIAMVLLAFVRAAPDTAVILLPLGLVGVVFAIVGVAQFGGKIASCIDILNPRGAPITSFDDFGGVVTMEVCTNHTGHDWVSPPFNFDNSLNGMLLLFTAMTDGTHPYMVAYTQVGVSTSTPYWVAFHLIFTCFFLNLFLGVLTVSFEKSKGIAIMTLGEKQWGGTQRMLALFNPGAVKDDEELRPLITARYCGRPQPVIWYRIRKQMFTLATNERLEAFWCWVIATNTLMLTTDMYPIGHLHGVFVTELNQVFLFLYTSECTIKLIGFGARHFFSDGWMVSDFVLVTAAISLRFSGGQSGVESLRVLRVLRIIVLASIIPSLVTLIDIMIACMRASVAVILLTSLTVYVYSIIGMNLFGSLPTDEVLQKAGIPEAEWEDLRLSGHVLSAACPSCKAYSDYTNFNGFPHAFRLLVQQAFGQGIAQMVADLHFLGANFYVAYGLLASFYMITVWVFMNLFIVTVLSNIASTGAAEDGNSIGPNDLDGFAHTWAALTIGVHRIKAIEKTSESLLAQLTHTLMDDKEDDPNAGIASVVEDGPPEGVGQLSVTVEAVNEIPNLKSRVYCALTMQGTDIKGQLTHFTPVVPTMRGKVSVHGFSSGYATWKDKADGASVKFHTTGFHTHLTIELMDSYQFGDQWLGAVAIEVDQLREMSEDAQMTVELLTNDNGDLRPKIVGERDRWSRYQTDWGEGEFMEEEEDPDGGGEEEDSGGEEDDNDDADVDKDVQELDDRSAMEIYEQKEEERKEKRAKQKAKALRKKWKAAEDKRNGDASPGSQDSGNASPMSQANASVSPDSIESPSNGDGPRVWTHQLSSDEQNPFFGWRKTGIKIVVRFEFIGQMFRQPTTAFLESFGVRYHQKEPNCGAEGWLELSEGTKPFAKRFCYIQDEPVPCLKFHSNASTIDSLEALSLRGKLETKEIPGRQMVSVSSGHVIKTRKGMNLQIEYDEPMALSTRKQEAKIGILSGVVKGGSGLKAPRGQKGVVNAILLPFLVPEVDDEPAENIEVPEIAEEPVNVDTDARGETSLGAPESPKELTEADAKYGNYGTEEIDDELLEKELMEDLIIEDEEGQVQLEQPARYMSTKRAVLRVSSCLDSVQVGYIQKGDVVLVTHTKIVDKKLRLRCEIGWVSAVSSTKANVIMMPESSLNKHFRLKRPVKVERYLELSKNSPADIVGELSKNCVVEVVDTKIDPVSQTQRLKVQIDTSGWVTEDDDVSGWISEVDLKVQPTPAPYCVVEIVPVPLASKKRKGFIPTRTQQWQTPAATEDPNEPKWGSDANKFQLDIFASSLKLNVKVMDDSSGLEMGSAEIELGENGVPGPKASSGDGIRHKALAVDGTELVISLIAQVTKQESIPAGVVSVQMAYKELVPQLELLAAKDAARGASGDLVTAMLMKETRRVVLRLTAADNVNRRLWLAMLRWVAVGAPADDAPRKLAVSQRALAKEEMLRLERDIKLVDLPFDRAAALLTGLYKRGVMGGRKPTLRRQLYTLFQLEVHAWKVSKDQILAKKKGRRGRYDGTKAYLDELRGLQFDAVLERITLLHYGKQHCLSYADQVKEYRKELNHIALQQIKTAVAYWIYRKSWKERRSIAGRPWPWHSAWADKNVTGDALEASCAMRLRSCRCCSARFSGRASRKCTERRSTRSCFLTSRHRWRSRMRRSRTKLARKWPSTWSGRA